MVRDYEDGIKSINQSEEMLNLLEHAGWEKVIKPEIDRQIVNYERLLPGLVLNKRGGEKAVGFTAEECAGRLLGFKHLLSFIEATLEKGAEAFAKFNTPTVEPNERGHNN